MRILKILKYPAYTIGTFVLLIGLYLLSAFILSHITVGKEAGDSKDMSIYIKTNGVHTDLVLPVKTQQIDWRQYLSPANTAGGDTMAAYIAMGWGDKGFYLETPTWADLKYSTAFKAAFALSSTAVHATYYRVMNETADCKRISISQAQYERLVRFIRNSFCVDTAGRMIVIATKATYGDHDAFYEAKGRYSLFRTCNTWANDGLKSCGQKACLWTPFDKGIFYQYSR